MRTVFIDESGYSGPDFLSSDQPVFALASLALEEEECRGLSGRFFNDVKASELKHSRLARRPRHQQAILAFLDYLGKHQEFVKISLLHKRFALVCKMVDLLIEPSMRKHGHDVYERGLNLALANLTYVICTSLAPNDLFDDILSKFQTVVREPTLRHLEEYAEQVQPHTGIEPLDEILKNYHLAVLDVGIEILPLLGPENLDIHLASALEMMAEWRAMITGEIRLVHDEASAMAHNKAFWEAVVDPNLPSATVGYDRRKMQYPIAVSETVLASSHNWVGLQLADLVAGALARASKASYRRCLDEDQYASRILNKIGEWDIAGHVTPESKFDPEALGTVGANAADPNDHIADILLAARKVCP